jgi:hypothetical protein
MDASAVIQYLSFTIVGAANAPMILQFTISVGKYIGLMIIGMIPSLD